MGRKAQVDHACHSSHASQSQDPLLNTWALFARLLKRCDVFGFGFQIIVVNIQGQSFWLFFDCLPWPSA